MTNPASPERRRSGRAIRRASLLSVGMTLLIAACGLVQLTARGDRVDPSRTATKVPRVLSDRLVADTGRTANAPQLNGLRVSGNRLVDDSGNPVMLRGVFYASFHWACDHEGGIPSQPIEQSSAQELLDWHINFVRIGVAEDCWLGINGLPLGTTASAYRDALKSWVDLLHKDGIYTEIGLMDAGPGSIRSTQMTMPDEDHSPAFWQSFASTFKDEPDTIFGLYGEPHPAGSQAWDTWLNGGQVLSGSVGGTVTYEAAGMQQLIDTIRGTGATQPISVSGIDHAQDLSEWLQYEPNDPDHQLIAEWHEYGGGLCSTAACWATWPTQIASQVPLLNGEVGEHLGDNACQWSFMPTYLSWAEAHDVSYAAWKWASSGGTCFNMALIADQNGDPTPVYGQGYQAWLADH